MDRLRCIVIDDEPFALEMIGEDIGKIDFLELVESFYHTSAALEMITRCEVDLIFLDIQMPGVTGIQFLRSLPVHPMVIVTTAFEQYALDGFELDVVDYLLKPIPFTRFCQSVQRAMNLHRLNRQNTTIPNSPYLYVYTEYQKVKIPHQDILYIEGMKDYVKIFIDGQPKPVLTRMNLKRMESQLSSGRFCRIHNSFIVSLDRITATLRTKVFIGSREIPVGDKFAENFRAQY